MIKEKNKSFYLKIVFRSPTSSRSSSSPSTSQTSRTSKTSKTFRTNQTFPTNQTFQTGQTSMPTFQANQLIPTILEHRVNTAMEELQKLKNIFQQNQNVNKTAEPLTQTNFEPNSALNLSFIQRFEHSIGNIPELIALHQSHHYNLPHSDDPHFAKWVSSPAMSRPPLKDDLGGHFGSTSTYNHYPSCGSSHLSEFGSEATFQNQSSNTTNQAWKDFLNENSDSYSTPAVLKSQIGFNSQTVRAAQEYQRQATIHQNGNQSQYVKSQYNQEYQRQTMIYQNGDQSQAVKDEPIEMEGVEESSPPPKCTKVEERNNYLEDLSIYPTNGLSSKFLSLRSQLSSILDAFTIISGKLSIESQLAEEFVLNHQRQKPLEKTTLMSQLSMIASTLTEFAASQFLFSSLCKEDQATLLKNNIPLYLQYILARYFSAETGMEQLNWIMEGQINIESIEMVTSLSRVGLKEYNTSVNLFPTSEMVEIFSHYVGNIGLFYPFPQHCNGLIANMLLYYVDESIAGNLKEEKRICCIFEEAKELVKIGFDHLDRKLNFNPGSAIGPLMNTLSKMKTIFGNCRVQRSNPEDYKNVPKMIPINYTESEESWMKSKFDQFQAAYISVEPTTIILEDLVNLLNTNTPVTEMFMPNWMEMTSERMRRVLRTHSEFSNLPISLQEGLFRKNHSAGRAIAAVQMDSLKTGKDQLRHCVGELDSNERGWETQFSDVIDLSKLKCSYLSKPELNLGKWDEASLQCYFEISKDISEMCFNERIFQLFILLTMLDTDGLPHSPYFGRILRMRQIYLKFIQRKMMGVGFSFGDYAHFRRTLQKVKIFANLLENFVT